MTPDDYCQQKAAQSGSSFYYSFLFLEPRRRRAITALYAFCREVDDVVDECNDPQIAAAKLAWWRLEAARIHDGTPEHPVGLALQSAAHELAANRGGAVGGPIVNQIGREPPGRILELKRVFELGADHTLFI